ncbi:FAD-dependent monooxygenase [Actinorugispora endophytica]|uniref:2-polyprenyl-6-methoxyphenol hydroxylase-like FAD-dependent oxidoreductase n=1 Tax=Actinorugispora endophytica TaxID=1605990 RepID=A0A4V6PWW1_9ACTN|nr:FAD-dependent monooxygenase [Actinorugispora endophytica]TDQ53449.1 2-polyprenyl-6-methoxyphenol hydroxylase-like FAD-dependent oxidoreductase [Actinorugispora endophytica]
MTGPSETDVLVVGAGPTGLALAAQLAACGARFLIVDRATDPARESRALVVQPRTLEVLAGLGVTDALLARGNRAVGLRMHAGGRSVPLRLFDIGSSDTAYPFLLFLSQARTERVLADHLADEGVLVERGVELFEAEDGRDHVTCMLRRPNGKTRRIRARYLIGCDGPRSSVRGAAHIEFGGRAYPQTFLLGDVEADSLEPGTVHAFMGERGLLFFFPLGGPATWRVFGTRPPDAVPAAPGSGGLLSDLQELVDGYTGETGEAVRLSDPVWLTEFRLNCRQAVRYRRGRMFLAGDAAHVHSPAGAQGMNTGIGDACNLGWKLALVTRGVADEVLLDSYDSERRPVGAAVLRLTDRAFSAATSTGLLPTLARTRIAPRLAPAALRLPWGRSSVFRALSQLAVGYRDSEAVAEGDPAPRHGPRAGDRLPDASLTRDGAPVRLHQALAAPTFHLLLCGPPEAWAKPRLTALRDAHGGALAVHHLTADPAPGALYDQGGRLLHDLGVTGGGHYLVRPDTHIAHRGAGPGLDGLHAYLDHWLTGAAR